MVHKKRMWGRTKKVSVQAVTPAWAGYQTSNDGAIVTIEMRSKGGTREMRVPSAPIVLASAGVAESRNA